MQKVALKHLIARLQTMNFSQLGFGFFVLKINGILLAATFFLVAWHYFRQIERKKFPIDFFVHNFWKWIVIGLILGRIGALLMDPEIFARHGLWAPAVFWDGEIDFVGFFIGALGGMFWDTRRYRLSFWKWIDLAVPSTLIGVVLLDFIQFFTGSIYGTETSLPWGVQYETFGVETLAEVHPVTLYAVIPHIILLNWALKKQILWERQVGRLSFVVGLWLSVIHFFLEFFYGNEVFMVGGALRIGQVVSLVIAFGCVVGLLRRK